MTDDILFDKVQASLVIAAETLHDSLGMNCVCILGTMPMNQAKTVTAFFAGSGSVYEQYAVAKEFCLRFEEQSKKGVRA